MSQTVCINGQTLPVKDGVTILEIARQNGIYIPTLCNYEGLPSHGSCRLCLVEIQGKLNPVTACTTPAEGGMTIQTDSPKVNALRAELLRMMLSEHPSCCLFCPEKSHCADCMVTLRKAGVTTSCRSCPKDSQCELQDIVQKSGIDQMGYPVRYRMLPVLKNDPFFDLDYNLCILCGRCVRACKELHDSETISYTQRGTDALVSTPFKRTHLESGCLFCGVCVELCPTGALSEKTRKWDGKPDRLQNSICPFCSLHCETTLLVKNQTVIGSLPDHSSGTDFLCVKGRFGMTELVNHPGRLQQPQKLWENKHLAIPWEDAYKIAADRLAMCSPGRFGMIVSPDCSNEDLYIARKFTHEVMKSENIQTSAQDKYGDGLNAVMNLLHESHPLSIVSGTSTVLTLGLDDKYAQSVINVKLRQARKRGAEIISTDFNEFVVSKNCWDWLNKASQPLTTSKDPVIILGPSCLILPDNRMILETVNALAAKTGARLIVITGQSNLAGVFALGLNENNSNFRRQDLEVLFLIGEDIPQSLSTESFVIYQNLFPPTGKARGNLILPVAAFTEVEGTCIDYSGVIRETRPAVPPTGETLPTWMILCNIAIEMGINGFDFDNATDVQADIARHLKGLQIDSPAVGDAHPSLEQDHKVLNKQEMASRTLAREHIYMGFPQSRWVEGLRSLYPEKAED